MHTITAAIARARIDSVFYGHDLTPGERIELATLIDANEREPLTGIDRAAFERMLEKAYATMPAYHGPDERY